MTELPDPYVLYTNEDWKDVIELITVEDEVETFWEIPALTPLRMQIREKACSIYIDLELSTANGRLLITETGRLAFNVPAGAIRSRLGPQDCEDRSFETDILAWVQDRWVGVSRFDLVVKHGVTTA
ncbi:MAG: hypothetical protein ACK4GT_00080 [Pararhodobacter sp.]